MPERERKADRKREKRIENDVMIDVYEPEDEIGAWFVYLESKCRFPFKAVCTKLRQVSPLRVKQTVEILGMADDDECQCEMFVLIPWEDRPLAVPLAQLKPAPGTDQKTREAVGDWLYWLDQRHTFYLD